MAKDEYHFERLTPINDIELKVYEDAINYVFENQDIKNVAISGAYSAGKSSVLESYKKKHSELKFLHISLAHFQSPDLEEETEYADQKDHEEKGRVKESVLEGKILNQLIHQIPSDKISQTNFRVKRKIKRLDIAKSTVIILMLVLMILYFVFFKSWGNYVLSLPDNILKTILSYTISQYSLLISGIILTILLGIVIYGVVKIQKNKNVFRKLNFQGNEIEIFEESNDSYFDKYLNEVLYLFENAEVDAIVFEDMDRFNVNSIFERLREVNTLVNIRLQKDNNKKFRLNIWLRKDNKKIIRFFYLLRDDIFVSKDRTKFFDYIIPVVPVLDSSNSYDQFLDLLKKGGILQLFDNNFLQGLSLYIDDMRLLKNIYNEFVIYYNRINTTELDCNKMLAMITYKNLFPRDFSELQLNQGFVFTLFNKKDEFIADEIEEIENQIEEIQKKIKCLNDEHLISTRELSAAIADKYLRGYNWESKDDNNLSSFILGYLNGSKREEYVRRKKSLEDKLAGNISQLEDQIYELEEKKNTLRNQQLYELINRNNINRIFSTTSTNEIGVVREFKEIKSSEYFDLLKYLIRHGYIDETYSDYMTYFYENSLSRVDKIFLRSISDSRAKEHTYRLKNPKLVVSRLKIVDFDQEEALNFDLFAYLLKTPDKVEYLNRFINQLKNTKNYEFVGTFFDTRTALPELVRNLNIRWPEMLAEALDEKNLSEKQIWKYSVYTLYYSDSDTIRLMNQDNVISDYISNERNYLSINDDVDIEKLVAGFRLLEVRFKGIDYEKSNMALFQSIYEESLYVINSENIQLMLCKMCGIEDQEAILHKNYSILCSISDSAIAQYIEKNMAQYIDVMLQMCEGCIMDDETAAVTILNKSDITKEQKEKYIQCLDTVISQIVQVEDSSLWGRLLDNDSVHYSEENIFAYFEKQKGREIDHTLISFINRHDMILDFSDYNCAEESKEQLFISFISCNDIDNAKYARLLLSFMFSINKFTESGISDEKIDILIKIHVIQMTKENLVFMRDKYPDHVLNFINGNIEQYVDIMDNEIFSLQELLEVLKWKVSDEIKIQLMSFTNQAISIINEHYSTKVCIYILENNFLKSDLPELLQSYDNWDKEMQAKIYALALAYISDIIADPQNVSSQLKNRLLYSRELNIESRIDLLIAMLSDLDMEYVKPVLAEWGFDDYIKIFDNRSRPRFEISPISKKILEAFKKKRWIQNYEEDGKKPGFYKIIRRKAPKELPKELL